MDPRSVYRWNNRNKRIAMLQYRARSTETMSRHPDNAHHAIQLGRARYDMSTKLCLEIHRWNFSLVIRSCRWFPRLGQSQCLVREQFADQSKARSSYSKTTPSLSVPLLIDRIRSHWPYRMTTNRGISSGGVCLSCRIL